MNVFLTGATGYIGGSVAAALVAAGHNVRGLLRSAVRADELEDKGIEPVIGSLEDGDILSAAARDADAVINAASADARPAVENMLAALAGSDKLFLHTSGSSIVGTRARGEYSTDVFDETTLISPSPARAARVALNGDVLAAAEKGVRAAIVCPSLIYGLGHGLSPHSMQVPWLIALARKHGGVARYIGSGANVWSNVHISDLVALYLLALNSAHAGALYYAENGENSMLEMCEAISRMLGQRGKTASMTLEEASAEWGEGPANDTMASNSRVRAVRARNELGWTPTAPSLIEEIERGCYADTGTS